MVNSISNNKYYLGANINVYSHRLAKTYFSSINCPDYGHYYWFGTRNTINKVQRELIQNSGKQPTLKEIAASAALNPSDVQTYLQIAHKPISLDIKVGEAQDNSLQDFLENTHNKIETSDIDDSLGKNIQELLYELTPSEREVIILVFGLKDGQELSVKQVASLLNISYMKVNRLKKKAIKKLRSCKQKFAEIN